MILETAGWVDWWHVQVIRCRVGVLSTEEKGTTQVSITGAHSTARMKIILGEQNYWLCQVPSFLLQYPTQSTVSCAIRFVSSLFLRKMSVCLKHFAVGKNLTPSTWFVPDRMVERGKGWQRRAACWERFLRIVLRFKMSFRAINQCCVETRCDRPSSAKWIECNVIADWVYWGMRTELSLKLGWCQPFWLDGVLRQMWRNVSAKTASRLLSAQLRANPIHLLIAKRQSSCFPSRLNRFEPANGQANKSNQMLHVEFAAFRNILSSFGLKCDINRWI